MCLRISGSGMNARGLTPDKTGQEEKPERGAYAEQLGPAPRWGWGEEERADHTRLMNIHKALIRPITPLTGHTGL